jgi:peptidoglycan/LPS O-acetylase OafA/YrhL
MNTTARPFIPALTGLRFFAGLFVALAHLMPLIMPFSDTPWIYEQIRCFSAEAMSLFFVLSGFIIHYNYSESIERHGKVGVYNFLVARFARIYPLYVLLIGYQWLLYSAYQQVPASTLQILPCFLVLAQTWFYWPVGKYGLIYEFGLTSIAWSVSTELFFYLVYPFLRTGLKRLHGIRSRLILAAVLSAVVASAIVMLGAHSAELNRLGIQWFGAVGDPATQAQYSFERWLLYFSPYSRIFEFVLGCIGASIFMTLQNREVSVREERFGLRLLIGAIIGMLGLHLIVFGPAMAEGPLHALLSLHYAFGFAPFLIVILFCCARYNNAITRSMSSWPLILCGEATYSLYLLHMIVAYAFRWETVPVSTITTGLSDLVRLVIAVSAAIGLSLVSWRVIEVPTRKWMRSKFSLPVPVAADLQAPQTPIPIASEAPR